MSSSPRDDAPPPDSGARSDESGSPHTHDAAPPAPEGTLRPPDGGDTDTTAPSFPFPVVGIGASAGGIEALEEFFDHLPTDTGAAYVVIQHLSPDFQSLMDQLLGRRTRLTVKRAEDRMSIEPEHVYLIPPGKALTIADGHLAIADAPRERVPPLTIDTFLRSLAHEVGERAVAVILSGSGSDGSRGILAVKGAGGFVLCQDRGSARFDGMPQMAIASGVVDVILPPADLARRVASYVSNPTPSLEDNLTDAAVGPLTEIFSLLRGQKGIDFSLYRERTILRRLARRINILQLGDLESYLERARKEPAELDRLHRDLLIGVTDFFRDPDAFEAFERELPNLFSVVGDEGPLRVWVTACSGGEEAYTYAMILEDYVTRAGVGDYKIFATDVDPAAVSRAGARTYPPGIAATMRPDRLQRYFELTDSGYQITRALRDRVVFAVHDLTKDPPFTRMHVASCRNLLIYLKPEVQERVLRYLHFALVPHGVLMMGPSETPGSLSDEFAVISKKWRVLRKRRDVRLPVPPSPRQTPEPLPAPASSRDATRRTASYDPHRVCSAFISEFVPAAVLLNGRQDVLHIFGDPSPYLQLPAGRATLDILKLLSPEARTAISTAIHQARKGEEDVHYPDIPFSNGRQSIHADLKVKYLPGERATDDGLFLLLFGAARDDRLDTGGDSRRIDSHLNDRVEQLERELSHTRENLNSTIAELETTNEEHQASNEELLAANEELQSTNEELHSVNEELYTVNAEHQRKIEELTELTADVENLLASTQIGTIFLDADLLIRKFTDSAQEIMALMETDVGRPIGHLSHGLRGVDLRAMAAEVVDTGASLERETLDENGRTRLVRVLPYESHGTQSGAVITVIDVDRLKRAERSGERSESMLRHVLENIDEVFAVIDRDSGSTEYVSPNVEMLWRVPPEALIADPSLWFRPVADPDRSRLQRAWERALLTGRMSERCRLTHGSGEEAWVELSAFPVATPDQDDRRVALLARDVTEQKRHEDTLLELTRQARVDAATGLLSVNALPDALDRELPRSERNGRPVAAVVLCLDDHANLRERVGADGLDTIAGEVAARFRSRLRPADQAFRTGPGELLVLLPDTGLGDALRVGQRLHTAISGTPFAIAARSEAVTASFHVTVLPGVREVAERTLASACEALARTSADGGDRVLAWSRDGVEPVLGSPRHPTVAVGSRSPIRVARQTIHRVDDGDPVGVELLIRGPDGPLRSPESILRPTLDLAGLTRTDLMCFRACLDAAAELPEDQRVHVNLLPSTLLATPEDRLTEVLHDSDAIGRAAAGRLVIEFSEGRIQGSPVAMVRKLDALRSLGVSIALDDLQFGRDALEAVICLEPAVVKLAPALIRNADRSSSHRRALERLVRCVKPLAGRIIAEAVESEAECGVLQQLGVPEAQGFYWDRPELIPVGSDDGAGADADTPTNPD